MSNLTNNTTELQEILEILQDKVTGVTLPELNNEGAAADLTIGKELVDSQGNVVVGTNPYDKEETEATVAEQTNLITQIQTSLAGKTSVAPTLQNKTVTPSTSIQLVTAEDDYDGLGTVTVNPIPSTYVKPTTTKGATTYTPKTTNQTIAAGTYCSGIQTIKGDTNLIPENIAEGVSIFGVSGTHSGGGGSLYTVSVDAQSASNSIEVYGVDSTGEQHTYQINAGSRQTVYSDGYIAVRYAMMCMLDGNGNITALTPGAGSILLYWVTGNTNIIVM